MPEGAIPKGGWFIMFCLGFIAGVGFYPFIKNLFYIIVVGLLIILVETFYFLIKKKYLFKIISFSLLILGFILGSYRFFSNIHVPTKNDIDYYLKQKISVQGIIISVPTTKDKNQTVDFLVNNFTDGQKVQGIIRANLNQFPQYAYGDKLSLTCKLVLPDNKTFNYQRYLARYHIYSLCFNARAKKIGQGGNVLLKFLYSLRQQVFTTISAHVNEPEASLVGPVMFGNNGEVADDFMMIFRRTGLTHIMAVSGFNVSILAVIIGYIFFAFGLKRKIVFLFTGLITFLYVVLVGAPASAVRAGVMSLMMLYALAIGRLARIQNIIVIVATVTLIANPLLLSADIGWQLSFLALLGLIYLQPPLKKFLDKIFFSKFSFLNTTLSATLAAQIATTPVTLYNFGQISLISPLANILVVGLIPLFTIVSLIALPIAAVFPELGDYIFLPAFFIAKYIIIIVKFLASFSWATFNI